MFKGMLWLSIAVLNIYIGSVLISQAQQTISLLTALYCSLLSLYYFYKASRAE